MPTTIGTGPAPAGRPRSKGAHHRLAPAAAKWEDRGAFTLSKSHNPVQDIYLRQVSGKENKLIGVASKSLADPGRGCRM